MADLPVRWQEVSWDGISLQLPPAWQTTVIRDSYLFFEQDGQPAFEIKWEQTHGRFSPERILNTLRDTLKASGTAVSSWEIPPDLRSHARKYSISGFKCSHNQVDSQGFLFFCPSCERATMFRFYGTHSRDMHVLQTVLQSFSDHHEGQSLTWAMYDIRALLPARAELQSHEFMAGRYTLIFGYHGSTITLYRFKPAAVLLNSRSLEEFGSSLAGDAGCVDRGDTSAATWLYQASGLERLSVMLGRKPAWIWLKLWHVLEKNVILGVKGSGKRDMGSEPLEYIAANLTATDTF
jgi:hypothetical protein